MSAPSRPAPAAGGLARAHRALALLVLAAGVIQFLLAGVSTFGDTSWDLHANLGRLMTTIGLILVLLAFVGRRAALSASVLLLGLLVLQNLLGTWGRDVAVLGALHPVNALLVLGAAMLASAARPVRFGPPHGAR